MDFHFHSLCHVNIHIFLPLGLALGNEPVEKPWSTKEKANQKHAQTESVQSAVQTSPDGADDVVNEGAEGERINLRELTGCLMPVCSPKSLVPSSSACAESSAHSRLCMSLYPVNEFIDCFYCVHLTSSPLFNLDKRSPFQIFWIGNYSC